MKIRDVEIGQWFIYEGQGWLKTDSRKPLPGYDESLWLMMCVLSDGTAQDFSPDLEVDPMEARPTQELSQCYLELARMGLPEEIINQLATDYLNHLTHIAHSDVEELESAQQSYGNSWKLGGGVSAFFMLRRKWDRALKRLKECGLDIFAAIRDDKRREGIINDIRDLRRYLMLVEAEAWARGYCTSEVPKEAEKGGAS